MLFVLLSPVANCQLTQSTETCWLPSCRQYTITIIPPCFDDLALYELDSHPQNEMVLSFALPRSTQISVNG